MEVFSMRYLSPAIAAGIALTAGLSLFASAGRAQQAPAAAANPNGPYHVQKTTKVGGDGGFDYVYADIDGRRLYIPRTGPTPRVIVFDLDTLEAVGEIAST